MRAGLCKWTGVIQRVTKKDDWASGSDSWATLATVYCSLRPTTGGEQEVASQLQSTQSHVAEWRYDATSATARPRDRMSIDSRTFEIASIYNVDERRHWIRAYLTEKNP